MFATKMHHRVTAHPVLCLTLAFALGLVFSAMLRADSRVCEPAPPDLFPPNISAAALPLKVNSDVPATQLLWFAMQAHQDGTLAALEQALDIWEAVNLPSKQEVWRHLALGVIYLDLDRLDDAQDHLSLARRDHPENAAVCYFTALLRLEQSQAACDYADALRDTRVRRVTYIPPHVGGMPDAKPRGRLELEAINELERAIKHADKLDLQSHLVPISWVVDATHPLTEPLMPPTVGDLLGVLGADNFVGKAHGLVAHLHLERGRPALAEYHLDQAHHRGICVPFGYRLAAEQLNTQGRAEDALRVYLKAIGEGQVLTFEALVCAVEQ